MRRSASQDGYAAHSGVELEEEMRPATQPAVLHGASSASSSSQPLPRPPASQPLLQGEERDETEPHLATLDADRAEEPLDIDKAAASPTTVASPHQQQQPDEQAATRMDVDEPTPAAEEQGDQHSVDPEPEPEPPLQAQSFHIDLTSSQATSILEATPPPAASSSHAAAVPEAGLSQAAAPPRDAPHLSPLQPSPPPRPPTPTPPQAEPAAAASSSSSSIPAALLQPSPPRRNLRTRKPGQLHPYTVEMALYKRRLERNDWEDAVVTDHHMRRRMREERERQAANELPIDGDGDEEDEGVRREREEEKRKRREEREEKRRRRDERRRREAEEAARVAVQEESQAIRGSASRPDKGKGKASQASTRRPNISTQELFARFGGMVSEDEDDDAASQVAGASSTPALAARGRPGSAGRQYGSRRRGGALASRDQDGDDSDHGSSSASSPVPPSRKRRAIRSTSHSSGSASSSPTRPHRRPQAVPPPHSSSSSSSSSSASSSADEEDPQLDLDRYFKQLKRMMPVSMARKYIADLRSMRKGKAYHSDGHESDTPEPSSASDSESEQGGDDDGGADMTMTPATSPADAAALRPGEARKRQGQGRGTPTMGDARFELVGDSDSESDAQQSVISVSSSSDDDARAEQSQAYDGDIRWWAQPEERGVRAPRREEDAIDRMLSRAVGAPRRPAVAASKRRRTTGTGTRRVRAAGGSGSAKRRPANQSSSTALRDRELNRPASSSRHATTPQQKQSAKRKRHAGATFRSRPSAAYRSTDGPQPRAPNPPVVQPRARRMLDLRQDDVLFDVELLAQPPPPAPREQDEDDEEGEAAAREAREYAERVKSYREQSQVGRPLVRRRITVVPGPAGAKVHTTPAAPPRRPIARTESRDSATSSKSPSVAHSSPPPPLRKGQGLRPFLRVSSRDGPASKTNTPPQMSRAQLDANSWADLTNLRLDFGIRPLPAGRVSFDPSTAIGRGRLFELVELGKVDATPGVGGVRGHTRLAGHTVLGVDLPAQPDVEAFVELMPQVFDAIFAAAETVRSGGSRSGEHENESQDDAGGGDDPQSVVTRATHGVDDLLRYLAQGITSLAEIVRPREVRQYVSSIKAHLVHLFERFQAASFTAERQGAGQQQHQGQKDFETLLLKLRWFDLETSWRHIASKGADVDEEGMDFEEKLADEEEMVLAAEGLMISLLSHGLHRTMHTIKLAIRSTDPSSSSASTPITDTSAELWISLIHLLNTTSTHLGPHTSFWPLLTSSLTQWLKILPPRRPVLISEAIWFVTLSLCCLSQFSASNGTSTSRPVLAQHWPLVVQAFSVVKLRYDESIEQAMPSSALARRDQYLRAVTQRCFNLVSLWRWGGEGAEGALSKIFDVFNAQHKLADLPTEEDHDFPPFLRELDEGRLWEEGSREGTTYHVFLKLLAHVARSLKEMDTTTAAQGEDTAASTAASDRKISRLFSRICPVRVMTFTRLSPPTSRERSSLFNHYSVAMLHLFLVPSAAPQRLRQIKSFLNFKEADAQSQVTCIRAMMYAAVVHRHFGLEVGSIVEWFGSIFRVLVGEAEEVNRKVARNNAGGASGAAGGPGEYFETQRQAKRVTSLLVAALRSIQHVVEHASLAGGDAAATSTEASRLRYPDPQLINRAWTADVLQTQSAIDPAVGMEVLKCIQSFLVQRNLAISKLRPRSAGQAISLETSHSHSASRNAQQGQSESQDSFAELFDDDGGFDFADPALDDLLDGGESAAPASANAATNGISPALADSIRSADLNFAHTLRSHLSPSLFSLISNIFHPDRAREGRLTSLGISSSSSDIPPPSANGQRQHLESLLKRGARRRYLELLVDCWAGCAHVLVENGLRDWAGYVTFGNECWRRLEDPIGKRDVALRFLRDVVVLDPEVVRGHDRCRRQRERGGQQAQHQGKQDHYGEFLQVWFASAPARCLSVQAEYTHALFYPEEEGQQVQVGMPWFPRSSLPTATTRLDLPLFEAHRGKLILGAVKGMRRDYEGRAGEMEEDGEEDDDDEVERAFRRTQVFPCLSALLSSMRVHLEALRVTPRLHAALLNGARRDAGGDTDSDDEGREGERRSDEARYLDFCQQVLRGIEGEAGEKILRGVKGELERTWVVVRRKEGEMRGATA